MVYEISHLTIVKMMAVCRLGFLTRNSAIAEGPREALASRNPATTKHIT